MTEEQKNWVVAAVEVCKAAAAEGVSVTITRRISNTGIDETNMEVGKWVQALADAECLAHRGA